MPMINLPDGPIELRRFGPDDSSGPPVVFVHGFLVDGTLWTPVAERLARRGIASYVPELPLGSHLTAMPADAELSPRGVAAMVASLLAALDLHDVTLVGNDTGGAICQLLLDMDASRVGRLVLTNCDAFENFPPPFFVPLFIAAKVTWLMAALMWPMRFTAVRHSPLAYGRLLRRPRDAALTRSWVEPARTSPAIRRDIARFARAVDRRALVDVAPRLRRFDRPVRVVWGAEDRLFTIATARRLVAAFDDAAIIEAAGASTFVPIDAPDTVVDTIVALTTRAPAGDTA